MTAAKVACRSPGYQPARSGLVTQVHVQIYFKTVMAFHSIMTNEKMERSGGSEILPSAF